MSQMQSVLVWAFLLVLVLWLPEPAFAQEGAIAGTVRESASGGVLPGVTVEIRSVSLVERIRSTVTDGSGQYRLLALPPGVYEIRVSLPPFSILQRDNIIVTAGVTTTVDADLHAGGRAETIVIIEPAPLVDVTSARQTIPFGGDEVRDLPTAHNLSDLMALVPAFAYSNSAAGREPGGVCVGGAGTWCTPAVGGFNAHSTGDPDDLAQGLVRLDGVVLNSASATVTGLTNGYMADVANAESMVFQLSGALGESETGGATIDIVPRVGGNVFRGTYITTYTRGRWFDRNDGTRTGAAAGTILRDYDVSGSVGGPILRDRLWFHAVLRTQGKDARPGGPGFYYNRNAGIWAAPYQPDRARGPLTYTNEWKHVNARITLQATQRNKVTLFWDEQETCQDPCGGALSSTWSPEASWSVRVSPNRVQQLSWANPFTSRLILEGGVTAITQHLDTLGHQHETNYPNIPTVSEAPTSGCCVGRDQVALQVHAGVGTVHPTTFGTGGCAASGTICSGSAGQSVLELMGSVRPRASVSYITGAHNVKAGWEAQVSRQTQQIDVNAPQLLYNMTSPAAACYNVATPAASVCGTPHPMFAASDPFNSERRPRPVSVVMNAGDRAFDDRLTTHAFYVQDQWTVRRFTIGGALRYDLARSHYLPTCLGPNVFVSDADAWCTERSEGVRFHDVSPRWGVAWDVFGDGLTAVRWNMGRYLQAARFTGVYADSNPARNTLTSMARNWTDNDGDRIVDCDLLNPVTQGPFEIIPTVDSCAVANFQHTARFGKSPSEAFVGTFFCGQEPKRPRLNDRGNLVPAIDYCNRAKQDLYQGSGARRHEWQFGLGIERWVLPQLSAGVTYNQRWFRNLQVTDTMGLGCDLYTGTTEACQADMLDHFVSPIDPWERMPQYSFYRVQAPVDPRLPNGGGYWIVGLNTRGTFGPLPSEPSVATRQTFYAGWKGIDTNVVLRARGGLRLHGGTSTGVSYGDRCSVMVNGPGTDTRRLDGNRPQCAIGGPWQTVVRGSASYTIPWVDVLASAVVQSLPGPSIQANMTYRIMPNAPGDEPLIVWERGHEWRASNTNTCPSSPPVFIGCFMESSETTVTVDLLDRGAPLYGSRYSLVDLKLAKNIRFARRRVTVGVDIYNLFNSDAIVDYNSTYRQESWQDEHGNQYLHNPWRSAAQLLRPRFVRVAVQFDF